jgi:hypothetical protein
MVLRRVPLMIGLDAAIAIVIRSALLVIGLDGVIAMVIRGVFFDD